MPRRRASLIGVQALNLAVDFLGRVTQRQLAQRGKLAFFEKILPRALRLIRQIYFALCQPLDQVDRRQVHQFDFIGFFEH